MKKGGKGISICGNFIGKTKRKERSWNSPENMLPGERNY